MQYTTFSLDTMLQHEYHAMREVGDTYWWYQVLRAEVVTDVASRFHGGRTCGLLDAGCGTSGMLYTLRETRPEWQITGLDVLSEIARVLKAGGLLILKLPAFDIL
jgi:ubiquinone/menaquinone biosynthesis C-methylase UbiE